MKNTFGNNISITLFGDSHGSEIGAVLDGLAPGIRIDEDFIRHQLSLRRPSGKISTARVEADSFRIVSGAFEGYTTGAPLCILISNEDTRSKDYSKTKDLARPGHADFAARCKYHGFEDYRGGGHFSGRLTAALVAAGAIVIPALREKGIYIGTHIKSCGNVNDRDFEDYKTDITKLSDSSFAVLSEEKALEMQNEILMAKESGDSLGGILETAIIGLEAGIGEPWFDSLEGMLSHGLFSIPAVKGVEFGLGFGFARTTGSKANDPFCVEDGKVYTTTNNSGGINGGISNGMPVIFRCAFRPTPTISRPQNTVDFVALQNETLEAKGRHDPCIIHRARVVVDSVAALVVADMLATRHGTDWLAL